MQANSRRRLRLRRLQIRLQTQHDVDRRSMRARAHGARDALPKPTLAPTGLPP
jgi:hypothetical protein